MEATSSRPFSSLEHFNYEDDESWTSSPPPESLSTYAAKISAGDSALAGQATDDTGGAASTSDGQTDGATHNSATGQSLQPLAKNWTFKKFFGR